MRTRPCGLPNNQRTEPGVHNSDLQSSCGRRSVISVGATVVREGFLEEMVHGAYWNSSIVSMDGLCTPSSQLASCFSFVSGKWDRWASLRAHLYNHSVFDSPNMASCGSGRQVTVASLPSLALLGDPSSATFHATFRLLIRYDCCSCYYYFTWISGCHCKVCVPKMKPNVFPSLKPSALLDSLFLLAAPCPPMLGSKP